MTRPATLVIGASGEVGEGIVAALLAAGWPVVAVARSIAGLLEKRKPAFKER